MQNIFTQCQSAASILLDASTSLPDSVCVRDWGRGMAVRLAAFGTGALSASLAVSLVLLTADRAAAQASSSQPKPVTGFVSTYEVMRTVRSAGFDPLVPPLREGTSYVLRATDFRGIPMRVVLDARTGAIRDVTRIVPAASGPPSLMPPSYGGPPAYDYPAYGSPDEYGAPTGMGPGGAPGQLSQPAVPSATAPARPQFPPMPRPRPIEQASQKPDTGTATTGGITPAASVNSITNMGANTTGATTAAVQAGAKPSTKSEATATVPAPATAATATAPPAAAASGKAPPVPPIND